MAGLNADPVRPVDRLRVRLRAVSKSDYCVNEKVPPSYRRQWKLFVRWPDGAGITYLGDDSEAGYERVYRDALRDAERHALPTHSDDGSDDA